MRAREIWKIAAPYSCKAMHNTTTNPTRGKRATRQPAPPTYDEPPPLYQGQHWSQTPYKKLMLWNLEMQKCHQVMRSWTRSFGDWRKIVIHQPPKKREKIVSDLRPETYLDRLSSRNGAKWGVTRGVNSQNWIFDIRSWGQATALARTKSGKSGKIALLLVHVRWL